MITFQSLAYTSLWLLVAVLYLAVFLLYRHFGQQLAKEDSRLDKYGPGTQETVSIVLETVDRVERRIGAGSQSGQIIMFTSPTCGACKAVRATVVGLAERYSDVEVFVVQHGDPSSARDYIREMPSNVYAVADGRKELAREWRIGMTPFFVGIDAAGAVIRKGGGSGRSTVAEIFREASGAKDHSGVIARLRRSEV
jgi:hypothetical protein